MEKLAFIDEQLNNVLNIPYQLGQWSDDVKYPYFVGEFTDEPITTEDGYEASALLITGFHRGEMLDLEEAKAKIKKHFDPIFGLRAKTDSGSIAVFYNGAFYVPTGEADLKRIQINLSIKEWKGVY